MKNEDELLDKIYRKYAWDYFALHANQRMSCFQYFIGLSTALVGGYILLLKNTGGQQWMAVLGFLLACLSTIFALLDSRTKQLIHVGEKALQHLDSRYLNQAGDSLPPALALISAEENATNELRTKNRLARLLSYSICFKMVYGLYGTLGVAAFIISLWYFPAYSLTETSSAASPICNQATEQSAKNETINIEYKDCHGYYRTD